MFYLSYFSIGAVVTLWIKPSLQGSLTPRRPVAEVAKSSQPFRQIEELYAVAFELLKA